MAQTSTLKRERVVVVMTEATFGVRAAATDQKRLRVMDSSGDASLQVEKLDNLDETVVRYDNPTAVDGSTAGSKGHPLTLQCKGIKTADKLGVAVVDAVLSQEVVLRHAFGRRYAGVATTLTAAASATSVTMASVANRRVGELVQIEVTAAAYEVTVITAIDTGTLVVTLGIALSAIPILGNVRGLRQFSLPEKNTSSLCVELKYTQDSGREYRELGCYGGLAFQFPDWNKIPTMTWAPACVDFQKDTTLAAPVFGDPITPASLAAPADDDLGSIMLWQPRVRKAATISRSNAAHVKRIEKLELAVMVEHELEHDDGTSTHGIGGVVTTSGRPVAVSVKYSVRVDPGEQTTAAAGTIEAMLIELVQDGDVWVLYLPRVEIRHVSAPVALGKRLMSTVEAVCQMNTLVPTGVPVPGTPTQEEYDMARSPIVLAIG